MIETGYTRAVCLEEGDEKSGVVRKCFLDAESLDMDPEGFFVLRNNET